MISSSSNLQFTQIRFVQFRQLLDRTIEIKNPLPHQLNKVIVYLNTPLRRIRNRLDKERGYRDHWLSVAAMNRDYHTLGIICTRKYLIPLIHCLCHRYTQSCSPPPSRFLTTLEQSRVLSLALALFIALEATLYPSFSSWNTLRWKR